MEYVKGQKNGEELAKYVAAIGNDMLRLDVPQTAKIYFQQVANKDFFTQAPIVPEGEKGAGTEVQYGEKTSKLSRLIGTGVREVVGETPWASPRRIDKVFQDLFSYGAYLTAWGTDLMIEQTNLYPVDPVMQAGEGYSRLIFGTGRFIKGDAIPKYTKSQQVFYELKNEMETAAATFRTYKRMGDRRAARAYLKENRKDIRLAKYLSRFQRKISKINQKIDIILNSRKYTAQEKRDKIDELILKRHAAFKEAVARAKKKQSKD